MTISICEVMIVIELIIRQDVIKAIEDLPNCYNGFSDAYDKAYIIATLEELPTTQQWISCSERLPLADDSVLITDYDCWTDIGYYDGQTWYYRDAVGTPKVSAWMPLPEPYKEDNNE